MTGPAPRRHVLAWLAALMAGVPLAAVVSLVSRARVGRPQRQARVPADPRHDVTFAGEVIVVRTAGGAPTVFSSKCPHLGCRIARVDGELLVCPCHGSRFRRDGTVVAGPAVRHLQPLAYRTDSASGELVVDVG